MAENTKVTKEKEAQSKELIAKDFTEGMVIEIKQKEKFGLTFPENYNYTNELMSAMLILQDTVDMNKKPVLQSCSRASIENALINMVTDGLSMRKKQCYPVAYAGKLSCQPSVYGATCVARRYGLLDIEAEVIYEGDTFNYTIVNGKKTITEHIQEIGNIDNDKIKGAYAIAFMKDGTSKVEIMTIEQIKTAWKQGIGYKEVYDYLEGLCTLEQLRENIKNNTRHFAKRQITWFKREKDIDWINLEDFGHDKEKVLEYMQNVLKNKNIVAY